MIGDFSFPLTFFGSVLVHVLAAGSKGSVSSVPAWFRVDSGMHLIKQMEIVTGLRCVWLFSTVFEFSHGMREVLGSNHRSDHILFPHLCHLMAQCGPIFVQRAAKSLSPATAHVNP